MAYNLACLNHLDENVEHRKDCTMCDSKGMVVCDKKSLNCPMTDKKLKVMGQTISGGIMMSKQQQTSALRQRSKKHYQTDIKERADQMQKDMIKSTIKT